MTESCSRLNFQNLSSTLQAYWDSTLHLQAVRPGSQPPKIIFLLSCTHTRTHTRFIVSPRHILPNLTMTQISNVLPKFVVFLNLYLYLPAIFQHSLCYSNQNVKQSLSVSKIFFLLPHKVPENKKLIVHCYNLSRDPAKRAATLKNLFNSMVSEGYMLSYLQKMHTKILKHISKREFT